MKCPKCNKELCCLGCGKVYVDKGRVKGGQKSKRTISPSEQKKMQLARTEKQCTKMKIKLTSS